ncbi:MAG: hypothetical protein LBQ28_00585 [Prevotellaceae bacterium]|nr:hypothetical protein [Prevotellaceae bacterium]
MKNEKLMINVIMVNGKYNAVIAGLTRYPLKEGIPAFAGMTNKKIPLCGGVPEGRGGCSCETNKMENEERKMKN